MSSVAASVAENGWNLWNSAIRIAAGFVKPDNISSGIVPM